MSLASELQRLGPDSNPWAFDDVHVAVDRAMSKEKAGQLGQPTDPITEEGYDILNALQTGINEIAPQHLTENQKKSFSRAAHLLLHSVMEFAKISKNSGLASAFSLASSKPEMPEIVTEAVQSTAEQQLNNNDATHMIVETATTFPLLPVFTSDISYRLASQASFVESEPLSEGLFHAAAALGNVAMGDEINGNRHRFTSDI